MTPTFRRRLATALAQMAVMMAPAERRTWVDAMRAEVEYLPDEAAPSFAIGCLWAAMRERATTAAFAVQAARWFLVLSAVAWSALNLRLAGRLSVAETSVPATFAYVSAAIYALGAVATATFGMRATIALIGPVLILAAVLAADTTLLLPHSSYTALYRALAIEHLSVLMIALLIALGVSRTAAANRIAS